MTDHPITPDSPEISLLLRSHAEQMWLTSEVLPIVRQLERPDGVPEEQVGAALAYLEMLWLDERERATDTEAVHYALLNADVRRDPLLREKAQRYYAAVCRLRASTRRRIEALVGVPSAAPQRRRITGRYAGR